MPLPDRRTAIHALDPLPDRRNAINALEDEGFSAENVPADNDYGAGIQLIVHELSVVMSRLFVLCKDVTQRP